MSKANINDLRSILNVVPDTSKELTHDSLQAKLKDIVNEFYTIIGKENFINESSLTRIKEICYDINGIYLLNDSLKDYEIDFSNERVITSIKDQLRSEIMSLAEKQKKNYSWSSGDHIFISIMIEQSVAPRFYKFLYPHGSIPDMVKKVKKELSKINTVN